MKFACAPLSLLIAVLLVISLVGCTIGDDENDDFPNCADTCSDGLLECDFTIEDSDDILALSPCNSVEGSLFVEFSDLTNLDGLEQLRSVTADLMIRHNSTLVDLHGLSGVEVIGGSLWIYENHSLPTCEATDLRNRLFSEGWEGVVCIEGNMPDECGDDFGEECD